ncbi:hypothetical protein HDU92_008718, partial [Lobulomyces angularis]
LKTTSSTKTATSNIVTKTVETSYISATTTLQSLPINFDSSLTSTTQALNVTQNSEAFNFDIEKNMGFKKKKKYSIKLARKWSCGTTSRYSLSPSVSENVSQRYDNRFSLARLKCMFNLGNVEDLTSNGSEETFVVKDETTNEKI